MLSNNFLGETEAKWRDFRLLANSIATTGMAEIDNAVELAKSIGPLLMEIKELKQIQTTRTRMVFNWVGLLIMVVIASFISSLVSHHILIWLTNKL